MSAKAMKILRKAAEAVALEEVGHGQLPPKHLKRRIGFLYRFVKNAYLNANETEKEQQMREHGEFLRAVALRNKMYEADARLQKINEERAKANGTSESGPTIETK